MAITDLTNTTWYVPSGWSAAAGYGRYELSLLIMWDNDGEFFAGTYNKINVGYDDSYIPTDDMIFIPGHKILPDDKIYINITRGTDVTNADLIAWLETNGELESGGVAATIKKGAYRFNDELTMPSWLNGDMVIPVGFTTRSLFDYDGTTLVPDDTRHDLNRITVYLQDGVLKVKESYIESGGGASSEFVCYEGGGVGWNVQANMHEQAGYTNFALAKGFGQIINVTEDTVIESERAAAWFEENLKTKMFKMLNVAETVYSSGGKGFKRLTTEQPTTLAAGLYDANDNLVASWDTLVNTYGMDVEKDYPLQTYDTDTARPCYVLTNYSELASGVKLIIDSNATSIGERAFYDCDSLTSIEIPDSVTSIGDYAFVDCSSLMSVVIGDRVTGIGDYAFLDCYKLVEVINKSSLNIVVGSYDYGRVAYYAIEVHNGESKIVNKDNYLFYTCDGVNYLLRYVGNDTNLILPVDYNGKSYKIHNRAFVDCSSLMSVVIGDSVTSIGDYAFNDCYSLTSIDIPDSVTSIGVAAFAYCTSLTSVIIGDSVTSIGDGAFHDCSSLTSVVIPDGVTSMGKNTFGYCKKLTSVAIPDSVTSIGSSAFIGCFSLTSVAIPDSVTSIGKNTFEYCKKLTSVAIPNSVVSIERRAFHECASLDSIKYRGTEAQWNVISKGEDWDTNTGNYTITYNYTGD